jgi:hypothetical protein
MADNNQPSWFSILSNWSSIGRLAVVLALLFVIYYGVIRTLPSTTKEFNIKGVGSIVFAESTKTGQEYLVIVHPQGWQETGVAVKKGGKLSFEAGGDVNVNLGGLVQSVERRQAIERKIIGEEIRAGRWPKNRNTFLPDERFTAEQKSEIKPLWMWNDPDGATATGSLAIPARREESIMKSVNYGALLGAIAGTGVTPERSDAFTIGKHAEVTAEKDGKIYFTVNDVWAYDDPAFPDKFFIDNIGFFWGEGDRGCSKVRRNSTVVDARLWSESPAPFKNASDSVRLREILGSPIQFRLCVGDFVTVKASNNNKRHLRSTRCLQLLQSQAVKNFKFQEISTSLEIGFGTRGPTRQFSRTSFRFSGISFLDRL